MSDTILPWLCSYLIDIAQQHGASPHEAPLTSKGKKVQLVKFLTYGEPGESQDRHIWARISDKNHFIPIRFTQEAMQEYYSSNQTPFTRLKTAIISIKHFRPVFRRVPLGGKGGMSTERTLTFDCNKFQYIGSAGEDVFGSPVTVEKNSDILEWSNGLSKDGGAGNVLKNRKKEQDAAVREMQQVEANAVRTTKTIKVIPTVIPPVHKPARAPANTNLANEYEKSWAATRKPQYRQPPAHIAALLDAMPVHGDPEIGDKQQGIVTNTPARRKASKHALDLGTSPASAASPHNRELSTSPGTVISGWDPSPSPSPSRPDPGTQQRNPIASQPSPPTPAQRAERNNERLPPSSPPLSSQLGINETKLDTPILRPSVSPPTHARRSVTRKVPRPLQPMPRLSPIGSARILVPNSDTSLSYSQSQSQKTHPSQESILHDILQKEEVHKIHSTSRNVKVQKEISQTHSEDTGDKSDREIDDGHSDRDSTHDSLFSGHLSDSENSSYDGDHSSLEPLRFREGLFTPFSTTTPHDQRPSHDQGQNDSSSTNHILTSVVVHPASSQRQDDKPISTTFFENSQNSMDRRAVSKQHIQSTNTDNVQGAGPPVPKKDDHKTHDSPHQTRVSTQSHISQIDVPTSAVTLSQTSADEITKIQTHVQPLRKSHSPTMSEIVSKTPRTGDQTTGEMRDVKPAIRSPHPSTSSDVQRRKNVVAHDAKAWLIPSFLRPSSSINIDGLSAATSRSATGSKRHSNALAKGKTPDRPSENTPSSNRTPKRQVPHNGDQNSDPSTRINGSSLLNRKQNKSSHSSSAKTEPSSISESSQSQLRKRARDSGHVPQTSSYRAHKKRKMNDSSTAKAQPLNLDPTPSDEENNTLLLGGWHHELDQPVLLSAVGDPYTPPEELVVTWGKLNDIWLRTCRRREAERSQPSVR